MGGYFNSVGGLFFDFSGGLTYFIEIDEEPETTADLLIGNTVLNLIYGGATCAGGILLYSQ